MAVPVLYGPDGRPIDRESLKKPVAGPTLTGVRSPLTGYPGDGLNPARLAGLLREADHGSPVRYLELAEQIEERDLHYAGVLQARKRAVSQLDITVEAASDDPAHVAHADMVRTWLQRDELADELFHILDAIGKGFSLTEIIWESTEGQWQPARLEWRDPRWFRFDRIGGRRPLLLDDNGRETELPPLRFVYAVIGAKSGLPIRSGIARLAAWAWMFKAFTQRDWAIFTQTFGQPLRVGKWQPGADEADKDTLYRAVANIAGDCAAIMPASMNIEFVEAANVGAAHALYKERCDWIDQQVSKAVLGQTATTDSVTGGLGSGAEHRMVQEDIERADCKALSAILNRDLVRPWIMLQFGSQRAYPRLKIGRPEKEDVTTLATALTALVPLGLKVQMSEVRDKLGLSDPDPAAELLTAPPAAPDPFSGFAPAGTYTTPALHAARRGIASPEIAAMLAERLEAEAQPGVGKWLSQIEAMLAQADSLEELRTMLLAAFPALDTAALGNPLSAGLAAAHAAGRAAVEDEAGG